MSAELMEGDGWNPGSLRDAADRHAKRWVTCRASPDPGEAVDIFSPVVFHLPSFIFCPLPLY